MQKGLTMPKAQIYIKGKIKQSKGDQTFDIMNTILLLIITFVVIYPLYFTVIATIFNRVVLSVFTREMMIVLWYNNTMLGLRIAIYYDVN